MTGFERHAEPTDKQVSRLSDPGRNRPWDQLLKVVLDETMSRCHGALIDDSVDATAGMKVDSYRSAVCAQFESLEAEIRNTRKGKEGRRVARPTVFSVRDSDDEPLVQSLSCSKGARKQSEVVIAKDRKSVSKRREESFRMSPAK